LKRVYVIGLLPVVAFLAWNELDYRIFLIRRNGISQERLEQLAKESPKAGFFVWPLEPYYFVRDWLTALTRYQRTDVVVIPVLIIVLGPVAVWTILSMLTNLHP
jgi:hypothetical protein